MTTCKVHMTTTKNAHEQLFETLNGQYFNGRLPAYRIVLRDDFASGSHGECWRKGREIHLATSLRGTMLTTTLLHEMAHAAVRRGRAGHGKAWSGEMRRLADRGAPTAGDWEAYQDRRKTITLKDMKSEAFDMGCEWLISWAKARPLIGHKYKLTDVHGRSRSKSAAKVMQKLRREFLKGKSLSGTLLG